MSPAGACRVNAGIIVYAESGFPSIHRIMKLSGWWWDSHVLLVISFVGKCADRWPLICSPGWLFCRRWREEGRGWAAQVAGFPWMSQLCSLHWHLGLHSSPREGGTHTDLHERLWKAALYGALPVKHTGTSSCIHRLSGLQVPPRTERRKNRLISEQSGAHLAQNSAPDTADK